MLKLKFNICVTNGCTQLKFTEETGFYSPTNSTGWGTPNINISDVQTAILSITGPNGVIYETDLGNTGLFHSYYPIEYQIPLTNYGNPTNIVDGEWIFVYTVTTDTETYTTTVYKYFFCNSECCVTNMLPKTKDCDCCDNEDNSNYIIAWTHLQSLKKAAECGDYTNFTTIKKIVDKLCKNSGCKTCK
jgi:hypothetical protein